ncbi:recombinase family protein [Paracoccus versutus]|uniref:recombinase family protein n=1 Tax=Paracoccus versutus TaxID=34007 RepID=UPI002441DFF2|nr:recombinase family protein [Paracoccus versutus]
MSLTEQIDTTTPQGRLIFNFFAMLAQFERDLIAERTKAGLAAARARGRVGGRKKLLSDADVRQAKIWLDAKTMNQQQAARALGVGRATLARALRPREAT